MPKRRGAFSKRQNSNNRHKVERKKRENKRDLKKAAKAMRKSGLRIRPKQNREKAKLALRLSSKDPNKEKALVSLLKSRERSKLARQERRQKRKAEVDAVKAEALEAQQQPDAAWMRPITANQLEKMQRQERKEQHLAKAADDQAKGIRRFLAFPTGSAGSDTAETQLRKMIASMRTEVPAFLITLDARCALECVPWSLIDDIVADAVAVHSEEESSKKEKIVRRIFFAITRADLVTADSLVTGAAAVAQMIKERYLDNEPLVSKLVKFHIAASAATASSPNINYILKALNSVCAEVVAERKAHAQQLSALSDSAHPYMSKKDINKVIFAVFGYPNTGRTALEAALIKKATTSACAISQASSLLEIAEPNQPRRFRLEDARTLTLLNVSDSRGISNAPILAGDVLFHRHSTADKMANPENCASKLLEDMSREDFGKICRSFGQGSSSDAKNFLFNLGRCVRREGGFYTPHGDDSSVVPQIAQGIFASSVDGASQPTLRAFHAFPVNKKDGNNAIKIGARCFLHEFIRGDAGFRWYSNTLPQNVKKSGEEIAKCLGTVFSSNSEFASNNNNTEEASSSSPASRRRQREDEQQQQETNQVRERGVNVVIGLQNVAQALPLASVGSVSGLYLDAALVSPQVEMELSDDVQNDQDVPLDSDNDDEDFDDDELEGGDDAAFGDFDGAFGDEEDGFPDMSEEEYMKLLQLAQKQQGNADAALAAPVSEKTKKKETSTADERAAKKKAAGLSPSRWDDYDGDEEDEESMENFWMPEDEEEEEQEATTKKGAAAVDNKKASPKQQQQQPEEDSEFDEEDMLDFEDEEDFDEEDMMDFDEEDFDDEE